MGYLRGFIPWIVAGVVSSFDWRWGALGGLVSGLLLLGQNRRRGVDLDALILEISTVAYFVVVGAVAVAQPHSALAKHTDVVSFGWLAATAWGTLAIRRLVDGSGWQGVYDALKADGCAVAVVQNPTLSLEGDVAATRQVIDGLPGPVTLVGHSYGGAVITEAGNHEKVTSLVYIAAFAPDKGESVSTLIKQAARH